MQTRSSGIPLVEPLEEPERFLRRRQRLLRARMAEGGGNGPDQWDAPMINRVRNVARTPSSAIVPPDMGEEFSVKGHHLKMIQDTAFDGTMKSDPHKHIADFTELCRMFKYGENLEDGVKLSLFPSSLTGEAKTWYKELEPESIRTWEELRESFVNRFFPPTLARRLLNQIRSFRQYENETIAEAWIRLKELLRNCHGHGLDKGQHIDIFYEGLTQESQHDLDLAGGGNFLYKSTNDAHKMMEDQVVASIARNRINKDRRIRDEAVSKVSGSSRDGEIMNELKNLSEKFDKRMGRLEKDVHAVKNGCEICGGPHYSSDCDQQTEEISFVQRQYQGQGNYQRGGFQQNRNVGYNTQNSQSYQQNRNVGNSGGNDDD